MMSMLPIALRTKGESDLTKVKPSLVGTILFIVFCALVYRLRQRDLDFVIEPDFEWQMIEVWREFFVSLDPRILPRPKPHVYLDGQFIIYGLADAALRWTRGAAKIQGDPSFALAAALFVDGAAYAVSSTIFFATVLRISGSITIAAVMAMGFFLSPQMIVIHLARVDYLNTLPISIIFYCSCILVLGEAKRRHAVALGAALALAATLKINGLFLGVIPACAALAAFDPKRIWRLAGFVIVSALAFDLTFIALMGRFLYHLKLNEIVQFYINSIEAIRPWADMVSHMSRFYYNFGILESQGTAFIALYLACTAATIVHAVAYRSRVSIFLSLCLLTLSVAGIFSLKHLRSGYHFLPVFFALIGLVSALIVRSKMPPIPKVVVLTIIVAALSVSFARSFAIYEEAVSVRKREVAALQILRRAPRQWLLAHLAPDTRICVQTHSQWTLPSLDGFAVTDGPMALPYLQPAELAATAPPSMEVLRKFCGAVVTSDMHRRMHDGYMIDVSPENAAKWRQFFADLNKSFPPVVFSSPVPVYANEITINKLSQP